MCFRLILDTSAKYVIKNVQTKNRPSVIADYRLIILQHDYSINFIHFFRDLNNLVCRFHPGNTC